MPLVIAGLLLTTAVATAHVTMLVWAYIFIGLAVANAFPIIISEAGRAAGNGRFVKFRSLSDLPISADQRAGAVRGARHFAGRQLFGIAGMAFLGVASLAMPRLSPARWHGHQQDQPAVITRA